MENEEKMPEETSVPTAEQSAGAEWSPVPEISAEELQRIEEERKLSQNMPMGVVVAVVAGLLCAALWTVITVATKYQIGYMAWAVGIAVGFAMRKAGKGLTPVYGILAAVIALVSCLLGNFLSNLAFLAQEFGVGFGEMLSTFDYSLTFTLMKETFDPIDILFYVLAVSSAYSMGYIHEKKAAYFREKR